MIIFKMRKKFFMEYAFIQWLIGDILIPVVTIGISLIAGFFIGRLYENRRQIKLKNIQDKNIDLGKSYNVNKK